MITRHHTNARMSQIVIHNDTVYLAGQVGEGASIADETRNCLEAVERLLTEAGTDKAHMLQAVIWLSDMAYYAEFNSVWDAWVPAGAAPARACGEAKLAAPKYRVEVIVTAALP